MTERLRSANTEGSGSLKIESDLSPRKTALVLVIVVGCFAVLWPKVFYPMLVGSAKQHMKPSPIDKTTGCCDVISEVEVNTIKIMSELCSTFTSSSDRPLSGKELVDKCRNEVLETCGIDISAVLQEQVRLGQSVKQIIDEVRSLNGSLCLKYNFGVPPWRLGVPHRVTVRTSSPSIRQERPQHLRSELVHPAFRERGRAIPQTQWAPPAPARPPPKIVEGRPGPVPGMRPTIGGPGHVVGPSKQGSSSMSIIMPIYTIGIVIFFTYTLMKIIFKKQPEGVGGTLYPPIQPDPHFRKEVFESERNRFGPRLTRDNSGKIVVNAMSALLDEVDLEIEARHKPNEVLSQDLVNGTLSNGDALQPQSEVQPTVKVLGMEMRASCEGGKKWARPESPVLPTSPLPPLVEHTSPPQEIYLEGTLPAQSQLLVSDSATEPQLNKTGDDPAVVLAGKMTLSVISPDSEIGADEAGVEEQAMVHHISGNSEKEQIDFVIEALTQVKPFEQQISLAQSTYLNGKDNENFSQRVESAQEFIGDEINDQLLIAESLNNKPVKEVFVEPDIIGEETDSIDFAKSGEDNENFIQRLESAQEFIGDEINDQLLIAESLNNKPVKEVFAEPDIIEEETAIDFTKSGNSNDLPKTEVVAEPDIVAKQIDSIDSTSTSQTSNDLPKTEIIEDPPPLQQSLHPNPPLERIEQIVEQEVIVEEQILIEPLATQQYINNEAEKMQLRTINDLSPISDKNELESVERPEDLTSSEDFLISEFKVNTNDSIQIPQQEINNLIDSGLSLQEINEKIDSLIQIESSDLANGKEFVNTDEIKLPDFLDDIEEPNQAAVVEDLAKEVDNLIQEAVDNVQQELKIEELLKNPIEHDADVDLQDNENKISGESSLTLEGIAENKLDAKNGTEGEVFDEERPDVSDRIEITEVLSDEDELGSDEEVVDEIEEITYTSSDEDEISENDRNSDIRRINGHTSNYHDEEIDGENLDEEVVEVEDNVVAESTTDEED